MENRIKNIDKILNYIIDNEHRYNANTLRERLLSDLSLDKIRRLIDIIVKIKFNEEDIVIYSESNFGRHNSVAINKNDYTKPFMDAGGYKHHLKRNKPKRTYWKTATIIVSLIAVYPAYYTIYNTNKVAELEKELNQQRELYKSFVDSIHSITSVKDSL